MSENVVWPIWSEGYKTIEQEAGASYHGSAVATTFQGACDVFAKEHASFAQYYDADTLTYWGCRLFDNETEARARYG